MGPGRQLNPTWDQVDHREEFGALGEELGRKQEKVSFSNSKTFKKREKYSKQGCVLTVVWKEMNGTMC